MQYLNNSDEYNFFITSTFPKEIIGTINDLKSNKATGPYSIPTEILDLIKINIVEPLTKLINVSSANALYFENLKVPKAIPVFKNKGTSLLFEYKQNY